MNNILDELTKIADKITSIEQEHNRLQEKIVLFNDNRLEVSSNILKEINTLHSELSMLMGEIKKRLHKTKRCALLISLLGQQDEVEIIKKYVDAKPYEMYVTTKWFKQQLK